MKHGHAGGERTPTYKSWKNAKARCFRKADPQYKRYGGRGITMCEAWKKDFMVFYLDMGERPEGSTLDRIDNDRNYEPGNCRWATRAEQSHNTSTSKLTEKDIAKIKTDIRQYKYIAEDYGICEKYVAHIRNGVAWAST